MNDKQRVAVQAAQKIDDGMCVGLGTGSTANFFIEALAERVQHQGLRVQVVSSSVVSAIKARSMGLSPLAIEQIERLDVYVDGADEVTPDFTLLKGRGFDLVREKLLARASDAFWVLIDASKQVEKLGQNFPIPIEVMPWAWRLVQRSLTKIGGEARLRPNGDGLWVTSHGSLVLDTVFASEIDVTRLNDALNDIPGVVEHGIFQGLASGVFCAHEGLVSERWVERG